MTTIGQAWRQVRDRFRAAGLETPDLDARRLAELALGLEALQLVTEEKSEIEAEALDVLTGLAQRRLAGEPVARIAGHKEFYGLSFQLNQATLVPRPETELLVDKALSVLTAHGGGRLLDLGTGSGAIAISVLANHPEVVASAVDLSPEALRAARINAALHGVETRLVTHEGSWFEPLPRGERFDVIVSNPPYIETGVIGGLAPDVRDFDPHLALDGGPDGLEPYRVIAAGARAYLCDHGVVMVEIGSGQGAAVSALFSGAGFSVERVQTDLAGLDRVVVAHHLG